MAFGPLQASWQGIGFFGASFPILVAHGRSFFPEHLMGTGRYVDQSICNRRGWRDAKPLRADL